MNYDFFNNLIDKESIVLPASAKINKFLHKNNNREILQGIDFLNNNTKLLHIHGFLGTGKRQYINYLSEFLNNDVIKLEFYCKQANVCDDILINFTEQINNSPLSNALNSNINAKITTLFNKFQNQISSIKKPFLIILHAYDEILEENLKYIADLINNISKNENVKIILSTKGLILPLINNDITEEKIYLKALSKEIFKEIINENQLKYTDSALEEFYKISRGYYFYTLLAVKLIQALNCSLSEFIQKFKDSGMSYDEYLGFRYISNIPTAIKNFFMFLKEIRHGISYNALAELEIYDEFSTDYLLTNLMIFVDNETIYIQDYFMQPFDITLPQKTEIKLHKYIIGIYEKQLKESLETRIINLSRQSLRAEIEYHKNKINNIENGKTNSEQIKNTQTNIQNEIPKIIETNKKEEESICNIETANTFFKEKKYTEASELYLKLLEKQNLSLQNISEIRLNLAKIYFEIGEYKNSEHYYKLVETYYKQNNEQINLCYLYYDLANLYYKIYKTQRAIETITNVIYSVDTPQHLLIKACTFLGNIYSENKDITNAFNYYKKALESVSTESDNNVLSELYFKYALANDDKNNTKSAFEYYTKCISITGNNEFLSSAYSNLASLYFENNNLTDALDCYKKAYNIEKDKNNYDGIYYNAIRIAKINLKISQKNALEYLKIAKNSAEFLNDKYYMLESSVSLGDYYYNDKQKSKECLKEYFTAKKIAENYFQKDLNSIESRIADMKVRMTKEDFEEIEAKYGK